MAGGGQGGDEQRGIRGLRLPRPASSMASGGMRVEWCALGRLRCRSAWRRMAALLIPSEAASGAARGSGRASVRASARRRGVQGRADRDRSRPSPGTRAPACCSSSRNDPSRVMAAAATAGSRAGLPSTSIASARPRRSCVASSTFRMVARATGDRELRNASSRCGTTRAPMALRRAAAVSRCTASALASASTSSRISVGGRPADGHGDSLQDHGPGRGISPCPGVSSSRRATRGRCSAGRAAPSDRPSGSASPCRRSA